MVRRGEELASETVAHDGFENAFRLFGFNLLFREIFSEVFAAHVFGELARIKRDESAGFAAEEAFVLVIFAELQTHVNRVRIVEEELHQRMERNRAAGVCDFCGNHIKRALFWEEADFVRK